MKHELDEKRFTIRDNYLNAWQSDSVEDTKKTSAPS